MRQTFHARRLVLVMLSAAGFLLSARSASAQSSVYVTGTAFANIKRFDHASSPDFYTGYAGDEMSLDGTGVGGGLRVGTFLHPRWSLELAVDAGARTKGTLPQAYRFVDFGLSDQTRFSAVSTVMGFHPQAHRRLRLGYLAGFSFVRGTYIIDYPSYYALATATTPRTSAPAPSGLPPSGTTTTTTEAAYKSAAVLGVEAGVDITRHLSVVPEIRALTFSGVMLVRPAVGVRWSF